MSLCFTLEMLHNNVLDIDGFGHGSLYTLINYPDTRSVERANFIENILAKRDFHYNFGDGWVARVTVTSVNDREAKRISRRSDGFCSYDWMVSSILEHKEILAPEVEQNEANTSSRSH